MEKKEKHLIHSMLTNQLVDNLIIFLFCAIGMSRYFKTNQYVIAGLVGLAMMFFHLTVSDTRWHLFLDAVYLIAAIITPAIIFFMPVILYHVYVYGKNKVWPVLIAAGLVVLGYFGVLDVSINTSELLFLSLAGVAAVVLSLRTVNLETTREQILKLRDDSTEMANRLKEKNKNLMEKQDYEVHLATLQERNRIAREIHDNVGHMLSRSILQMGALSTIYKEEPLHEQLVSVNDNLNQAMNNIRESVHDLHDDSIDLRQNIKDITKDMKDKFDVVIDYDMSENAPRSVKYCFVTIIKEAMSNVIKHSDGNRVSITLREHPGLYQLYIEDNGTVAGPGNGSVADNAGNLIMKSAGIGLSNMQDRVTALDGTIRFATDKGFSIFISIPKEKKNNIN